MDRLRIGTYLAPNIMPLYELVTERLGRRLGMPSELVVDIPPTGGIVVSGTAVPIG